MFSIYEHEGCELVGWKFCVLRVYNLYWAAELPQIRIRYILTISTYDEILNQNKNR